MELSRYRCPLYLLGIRMWCVVGRHAIQSTTVCSLVQSDCVAALLLYSLLLRVAIV